MRGSQRPGLQQQDSVRGLLRLGGVLALLLGGIFNDPGFEEQPDRFWMMFVGLPIVAVGLALFKARLSP